MSTTSTSAVTLDSNSVGLLELLQRQDPETKWVSAAANTRPPGDMEDRAAKYIGHRNLIVINEDFRVFTDMFERWIAKYAHAPGAEAVVKANVREWFEQQLIETILGCHALRASGNWALQEIEKLWTEEALTAAILPRYHVDSQVKRALGAKLGSLKS